MLLSVNNHIPQKLLIDGNQHSFLHLVDFDIRLLLTQALSLDTKFLRLNHC